MLSIFTVGLFLFALIKCGPINLWKRLIQNKNTLALSSIFIIYVISIANSQNLSHWLERINTNLTYIFVPIGILGLGPYSRRTFHTLVYIFIAITTISALIIGIDYVLHFHDYNDLYKVAKTIPTPIKHVRYSFYIGLAALLGIYLILAKSDVWGNKTYPITLTLTVFLFAFLHILSVRTGLLYFYISFLGLFVLYCIRLKSAAPLLGAVLLLSIAGFFSYKMLPSVHNKFHYTLYDLNKRHSISDRHLYSDVVRFASIETGLNLWQQNPLFGTGIGDIGDEMIEAYEYKYTDFPLESRFNPISQYVFTLVAFGILGFILFYGLFFYPFYSGGYKDYYLVLFYTGTAAVFLIESGIELQLGKIFFFALLCLRFNLKSDEASIENL